MDPDDLDYQLQCEALEKEKERKAAEVSVASSLAEAFGTYIDPQDGTVFEWDSVRKAWFPKIDANFIAMYQASYGSYSSDNGTSSQSHATPETKLPMPRASVEDDDVDDYRPPVNPRAVKKQKKAAVGDGFVSVQKPEELAKKKAQESAAWFDVADDHNRNVYVSNLPSDITMDEFVELMSKCGIVMKDPRTDTYKVKLYKDTEGTGKGDALCTYMKVESVPLALQILDGYFFRNKEIKVERAKFDLKGTFDPEKAKKQRLKKNEKKRLQKTEAKLLDWRPDKLPGTRPKHEKVVVIKNMFDPKEFEADPSLILEFKKDVQLECEKFGEVKKVIIYDRHLEGITTVGFADFEHADACIARMNGRWFDQRQLVASHWDGKTKYKIEESEEEEHKRLGQWQQFLDQSEKNSDTLT